MNAIARIDSQNDAMPRGGRRKDRDGPERRCIVSGDSARALFLIRFALSPAGEVVPDLAEKLPGRGAWLKADVDIVRQAVRKNAFNRAFRQPVQVAADLDVQLEALLAKRLIDTISMARKAGEAVSGDTKVRSRVQSGSVRVLLQASDGAQDGVAKVAALANAVGQGAIARTTVLQSTELGLAFGREFAIHAALDAGGFSMRALREAVRLSGFRKDCIMDVTTEPRPEANDDRSGPPAESGYASEASNVGAQEQDDR